MQTQNKQGISCDLCGITLQHKFEYIAAKFTYVWVDVTSQKGGVKSVDQRYLDLDLCPKCMDDIKNRVMSTIKRREAGDWTCTPTTESISSSVVKK